MNFRQVTQVVDGLLRFPKRNHVPQLFAARKDAEHVTLVFGHVMSVQLFVSQSGAAKMEIIQNGVFNSGGGNVADQAGFPNPFRNPHAADIDVQSFVQPVGILADLALTVPGGNHGQDGFVKRSPHDLNPAPPRQITQTLEVFGTVFLQPEHQGPAGVQADCQ